MKSESTDRVLVFTRTKHGADKVVRGLVKSGIAAQAIHGNKSQGQRDRVMAAFRNGEIRTLVATDIAARGIDVDGISHVVNFDLPNVPETYVHRIGRTARAGAEGVAISFCAGEEAAYLRDIEKLIRMSIPASDQRSGRRQARPLEESRPREENPKRPEENHRPRRGASAPAKSQHSRRGANGKQHRLEPSHQSRNEPSSHEIPGRIDSVAFLNREVRSSRKAPARPPR